MAHDNKTSARRVIATERMGKELVGTAKIVFAIYVVALSACTGADSTTEPGSNGGFGAADAEPFGGHGGVGGAAGGIADGGTGGEPGGIGGACDKPLDAPMCFAGIDQGLCEGETQPNAFACGVQPYPGCKILFAPSPIAGTDVWCCGEQCIPQHPAASAAWCPCERPTLYDCVGEHPAIVVPDGCGVVPGLRSEVCCGG